MHPQPHTSACICPVLSLWPPIPPTHTLPKPAFLREFTQVWGMWCTCLRTCIPFTHFSLGPSLQKWVCRTPPPRRPHPPPLGTALPTMRSHLYCCSYAMKPDGCRANHIMVEKSWPNRKETLIISVKLQPNVIHNQLGVINLRNRIFRL